MDIWGFLEELEISNLTCGVLELDVAFPTH